MSNSRLLAIYGLRFNPFTPTIPGEDLWIPPGADDFIFRVENLVMDGGFGLVTGDSGLGKSKLLQLLALRLQKVGDIVVGVMERPQSSLGDFYRELGDIFGVPLSPANRYGGFKALRTRWVAHIKGSLFRPVLLIDEAQSAPTACIEELRLLGSSHFDSECLLTTILCGDPRLPDRFRSRSLLAIGTRIRVRYQLEPLGREDLMAWIDHTLQRAGAPHLLSDNLKNVLIDHAAGNLRILTTMANELLAVALARKQAVLDEHLYLEVFARPPQAKRRSST